LDTQARDHLQRCFVLHRREYGDTSLIVEIFSGDHGRFPAVAKGARRARGGTAALLQPFQPLWLSWSGTGEVRNLTRSESAGRPLPLAGAKLYCGLYLNELLTRLLGRADPHPSVFAFYHAALADLAAVAEAEPVLRRFELQLLRELGYGVALDREAGSGEPVVPSQRYRFAAELGLYPVNETEVSGISGDTLLRLASDRPLTSAQAREARDLTRALLAPHLGPRPLKTRELFRRRPRESQPQLNANERQ
jgi:DNA repair protein RecO (recombination protein O)